MVEKGGSGWEGLLELGVVEGLEGVDGWIGLGSWTGGMGMRYLCRLL